MNNKLRNVLLFVMALFCTSNIINAAPADIVNIPDVNLKSELNSELMVADLNADITEAQLSKLKSITITTEGIKSFVGLEKATLLSDIMVNGDYALDLDNLDPLKNLTNLKEILFYSENAFSKDYSALATLTSLDKLHINIKANENVSVVTNLNNLTYLGITGVDSLAPSVQDLSNLSNLLSLETIDFKNVKFSKPLDFTKLVNLKDISLNNTDAINGEVSSIPATANLTRQFFSNNKRLSDVSSLGRFPKLTSINLTSNAITNLDFIKNLPLVTNIFATGNKITTMNSFNDLTNQFTYIYLDSNMINDVSAVKTMKFKAPAAGVKGSLVLNSNMISDFSGFGDFEGSTIINISALQQKITLPTNNFGDAVDLSIYKDHLGNNFDYITSYGDLAGVTAVYGKFTLNNQLLTWNEITPKDNASYNRLMISNMKYKTKLAGSNVMLGIDAVQNVIEKTIEASEFKSKSIKISKENYITLDDSFKQDYLIKEAELDLLSKTTNKSILNTGTLTLDLSQVNPNIEKTYKVPVIFTLTDNTSQTQEGYIYLTIEDTQENWKMVGNTTLNINEADFDKAKATNFATLNQYILDKSSVKAKNIDNGTVSTNFDIQFFDGKEKFESKVFGSYYVLVSLVSNYGNEKIVHTSMVVKVNLVENKTKVVVSGYYTYYYSKVSNNWFNYKIVYKKSNVVNTINNQYYANRCKTGLVAYSCGIEKSRVNKVGSVNVYARVYTRNSNAQITQEIVQKKNSKNKRTLYSIKKLNKKYVVTYLDKRSFYSNGKTKIISKDYKSLTTGKYTYRKYTSYRSSGKLKKIIKTKYKNGKVSKKKTYRYNSKGKRI